MKWSDEPYVRLYTRETPNTLMLSWPARAVLHELLKKFDRSGQITVTERVTGVTPIDAETFQGVALLIRVPIDIVVTAVTELVTRHTLSFSDGVLCMPNFPEAQEALRPKTDAERAQAYRRRVSAAKREPTEESPSRPVTARDGRHVLSSSSASLASSAVGGVGGRPEAESPKKRSRGSKRPPAPPPAKGGTLPEDWTPSAELVAELRTELLVDPLGSVPRFVDHHRQVTGRSARSRNWESKFRNWVRKDAADGKLDSLKPHRTMSEAKPDVDAEPLAVDASPEERKAIADRVRGALDLPKTGTT